MSTPALMLRSSASLTDRITGPIVTAIAIALPIVLTWALAGVALRCERTGPGAEPTCVVRHDYGIHEETTAVRPEDVRLARAASNVGRDGVEYCVTTIPRPMEGDTLAVTRASEPPECEADVAALRGFFESPTSPTVAVDRHAGPAWLYILLPAPLWLLALFGGIVHFERRTVIVDREAGVVVVRERVVERAFIEREALTIPIADIYAVTTGRELRESTLNLWLHDKPRVQLWRSSAEEATGAAADRLAAELGVRRM